MPQDRRAGARPDARAAAGRRLHQRGRSGRWRVPLGLTAALLALTLLPRVRDNRGADLVVLGRRRRSCSRGRRALALRAGRRRRSAVRPPPRAPQHYVQSLLPAQRLRLLGLVLAAGLRLRAAAGRAAPLRLRLRHAAVVVAARALSASASARSRSSSAPTCSSGSRTTGSCFQFLLIAVGFLGKAFVRWERDGKRVHIFNPSAFTLALFSLVLLVTGTTDLTWAQEINTTFSLGPRIYTVLFLIGLVVMYFFAITPVTATAAATLFGLSALYVDGDRACRTSSTRRSRRRCSSACTCWSPIRRRRRARRSAGRSSACSTASASFGLYALLGALGAADVLRQAAVRAAAQPGGAGDRSAGARARRAAARSTAGSVSTAPLGHRNLAHMAVWVVVLRR